MERLLTANSDRIEIEWKWLLVPDPSDYRLPKASANAIPLPSSRKAKDEINAKRADAEIPRKGDTFVDGGFQWAEFNQCELEANKEQAKLDLTKDCQVWHYLGKGSTDAKPQYTESLALQRHNPRSNYLDTLPKPAKPVKVVKSAPAPQRHNFVQQYPVAARPTPPAPLVRTPSANKVEKPYVYKPRKPIEPTWNVNGQNFTTQQFAPRQNAAPSQVGQQFTFSANQFHNAGGYYGQAGQAGQAAYNMQPKPAGQTTQNGGQNQATAYSAPNPFTQQRFTPAYTQGVLRPYSPVTTPSPATARPPPPTWPTNPPGQQYQQQQQQHYHNQPANKQLLPRQQPQTAAPYASNQYGNTTPYAGSPQGQFAASTNAPRPAMPPAQPTSQSSPVQHQTIYQKYPFFMVNHNR